MFRLALLSLLSLVLATGSAFAAFGDSPDRLDDKWGRPVKVRKYRIDGEPFQERTYAYGDTRVIVTFLKNKSHREIYIQSYPFEENAVRNVLDANQFDGRWKLTSRSQRRTTWQQGERFFASYNVRQNETFLTICSAQLGVYEGFYSAQDWYYRY